MKADEIKESVISGSGVEHYEDISYLKEEENRFDGLNERKIFAYGVGHFVNDLVAACWFNYLFFYLKKVVKTPAAPSAMLAGQIADGIATPLVGYFSDNTNSKYGKSNDIQAKGLLGILEGLLLS